MQRRTPFLVRHRLALTIGAVAAAGLLFAVHVYRWHFPHRVAGALSEWPLLAAALAAGLAAYFAVWRGFARFPRGAALPVAALFGLLAYVVVEAADPFVAARSWRYAPAGCDFAVSFPKRPDLVSGDARIDGAGANRIVRAVYSDVGRALALSADCVPLAAASAGSVSPATLDRAEALLLESARRLRLKVERVTRPDGISVRLAGVSDEGRTAGNEPLIRRAEARAIAGASSILILWAWRITSGGDAGEDAAAFFSSVRPSVSR